MKPIDLGNALDQLVDDVKRNILELTHNYRMYMVVEANDRAVKKLKSAVDTPHRVRAQIQAWISRYDSDHSPGSAVTYMNQCLVAAGSSKTVASINQTLQNMDTQAQTLVTAQQGGATWSEIATMIEALAVLDEEIEFVYVRLLVPSDYVTVWGEPI